MKRITAVILLALMTLLMFTGCKREGEMIETMVSTIFSTESETNTNNTTDSSGKVTDSDGHIGNENKEHTSVPDTTEDVTNTTSVLDDNVL